MTETLKKMTKNVLFVDENKILRNFFKKKFERCKDHFSVITAKDGIDAVEKLQENNIFLVIAGLQMPKMDGFALIAHLSEKYPDIPVIIQTGHGTPEAKKIIIESGAAGYFEHPFKVEDLGQCILATLEKESEGGTLQTISLEVFIQLIEMDMKTCTIRIFDKISDKQGVLFFKDGELLDARFRGQQGKLAANKIFSWDKTTLFIQDDCALDKKRIEGDLQAIMFDAIRLKDEAVENEEVLKKENDANQMPPANTVKDASSETNNEETYSLHLTNILNIDGVHGVMFISFEGKSVYKEFVSRPTKKIEEINWLSMFNTLNGIQEAELVFENSRFYLRRAETGFIVVIMGEIVPIEMVRFNCEILLPSFGQIL